MSLQGIHMHNWQNPTLVATEVIPFSHEGNNILPYKMPPPFHIDMLARQESLPFGIVIYILQYDHSLLHLNIVRNQITNVLMNE
jgi:hypothetical protein